MKVRTVRDRVRAILNVYEVDPEAAHSMEDGLLWEYVESMAPDDEVAIALLRLSKVDRTRWMA